MTHLPSHFSQRRPADMPICFLHITRSGWCLAINQLLSIINYSCCIIVKSLYKILTSMLSLRMPYTTWIPGRWKAACFSKLFALKVPSKTSPLLSLVKSFSEAKIKLLWNFFAD